MKNMFMGDEIAFSNRFRQFKASDVFRNDWRLTL